MRSTPTIGVLLAACGSHPQDTGPGDVIGPGQCAVAQYTAPLPDEPECVLSPTANPDTPCECEDYMGAYPAGVYDPIVASVLTVPDAYPGGTFDDEGRMKGCSDIVRYAMPDCTTLAQVSGHVATDPELATGTGSDDDYIFNICPIEDTMRRFPFDSSPVTELRGYGSFEGVRGRMHIEVQGCRYFNRAYMIKEPDQPAAQRLDSRPVRTDLVSAAGDWIWDANYVEQGGGWTEIHEARALAVTRPVSPTVSYSLVSAFFADKSLQRDVVALDIKVAPPPATGTWNVLECYAPDGVQNERINPKVAGQMLPAAMDPTVTPEQFSSLCPIMATWMPPVPDVANEVCQFEVQRRADSELNSFNCQGTCAHEDFTNDCSKLAAAVAIRAEWLDPADTWVCNNCACADHSAQGATISAPVQGCAQAGLDPANPGHQAIACSQVCGGIICGEAPSCRIDECAAPLASPTAVLVGRNTCEPFQAVPRGRVAPASDYRAILDPGVSRVKIILGNHSTTQPAFGAFYFNQTSDGQVLDFASSQMDLPTFEVSDRTVSEGRVFTVQRMFGHMLTPNTFVIPAGIGVFGVRGLLDGIPKGLNATNPAPLFGTVDIANRRFVLDVAATNPEESDQRLVAHLEGTIDNLPPVADAGLGERTVECTSPTTTPVALSAAESTDPDPNDQIRHYQWFDGTTGAGLGNTSSVTADLLLGDSWLALHVYDRQLGSDSMPFLVHVVDTTPPVLSVQPKELCLWPPNHRRLRFRLGEELQVDVHDVCDLTPGVQVVSVTSSEPDDSIGDGNTKGDVAYSDNAICIRRERIGFGPGRTYTAIVEASDATGNTSRETVVFRVPKSRETGCDTRGVEIDEGAPCE